MTQVETPKMTPTRTHEVEHDLQMSVHETRHHFGSQKLAKLWIVFNPYSSGVLITPSSGRIVAQRDPKTKAILPTPVEVQCYESEVPEYMGWVEDRMDMVREMFLSHDRMERAHIAKMFPNEYIDANRSEWPPHFTQALMKLPVKDNPAAKFRSIVQTRDILPLLSCEVVEHSIDAPLTAEAKARATMVEAIQRHSGTPGGFTPEAMATALVTALAAAGVVKGAPQDSEETERLRKANDGMAAKIKALEAKLAEAKK